MKITNETLQELIEERGVDQFFSDIDETWFFDNELDDTELHFAWVEYSDGRSALLGALDEMGLDL